MVASAIPDWIEVRRGTAPLLLFAPHAGRRTAPRRPGRDNVNDLYTAEVTRDLGARCDATWIINRERDRNDGDLNRVDQVQRGAPWLLDVLADVLDDLIAACGRAVLLTIHGWNVIQTVCDVGVGLVESPHGACVPAPRGEATVSPAFLESHVRRLQRAGRASGAAITIGARYPAAQPSNVLKLFTPARIDDPDPRIARLARLAPCTEAAQLELGIPLRWPGRRRDAFVAVLADVFRTASAPTNDAIAPRRTAAPFEDTSSGGERGRRSHLEERLVCGGRPTTRIGLQLAGGRLAVLTSIDVAPRGPV